MPSPQARPVLNIKGADVGPERAERLLSDASDAFGLIDRLIEEEKIDCFWEKPGRFVGAWTKKHFDAQARRLAVLNSAAQSGAYMVPRERQREEIASDYYFGGIVVERSGKLHPALYYKGLLEACRRRGVPVCAKSPVTGIRGSGAGWQVETGRGAVSAGDVVIATNGYTGGRHPGRSGRRVVPVASHIIATEELPQDLARSLIPKARTLSDTKRVLCYTACRRTAGAWYSAAAPVLPRSTRRSAPDRRRYMTDRFPQLRGVKVTHAWTGNVGIHLDRCPIWENARGHHYCLGRNGSGVGMMTYLGWQTARKIARAANYACTVRYRGFPRPPALFRQALVLAGRRRLLSAARQSRPAIRIMTTEHKQSGDFANLYRRAFAEYGTRALWNKRLIEQPTPEDALVVARALRIEGDLAARRLAEQIEKACRAAL